VLLDRRRARLVEGAEPCSRLLAFQGPVLLDQDGRLFTVTLSVAMYPAEPSGLRAPSSSSISGARGL